VAGPIWRLLCGCCSKLIARRRLRILADAPVAGPIGLIVADATG
jgi:hypothetical protein